MISPTTVDHIPNGLSVEAMCRAGTQTIPNEGSRSLFIHQTCRGRSRLYRSQFLQSTFLKQIQSFSKQDFPRLQFHTVEALLHRPPSKLADFSEHVLNYRRSFQIFQNWKLKLSAYFQDISRNVLSILRKIAQLNAGRKRLRIAS